MFKICRSLHVFPAVVSLAAAGADPGIGSGGGAQVRVWQGVGQSWMRSRPGEGAGGGHPSRPARGSGGAL